MLRRPSTRRQLTIANQYLHGELPAERAVTLLKRTDPFGRLLGGEVALDYMTKDSPHMASTWGMMASREYQAVVSQTQSGVWRDGYDHAGSRIKAQMRLAQITTQETMHRRTALPPRSTVETMYRALLKIAATTAENASATRFSRVDSAIEVRGSLGKVAVLLLTQRLALREIGCDAWLPLQSSFSEDNAGDCMNNFGDYVWDLNIFTPSGDNGSPSAAHRLKIRDHRGEHSTPAAGPTIYIDPDLRLRSGEHRLAEKIIAGCDLEAQSPASATRLTRELDARTALLLDVLVG